jgi:transposase-like protein
MADELSMALDELVRKAQVSDDVDFLREGVRALAEAVMELDVTRHVGAGRYERSSQRTGERNGTRERRWDTRVGSIALRVPRVRDGSYFPSLLEPRRRAERALVAVVQEAYVQGVSTRRVDELVQARGLSGISKSQVSLLCQDLSGAGRRGRALPYPPAERCPLPVCRVGCDLPQSACERTGSEPGGGDRHRAQCDNRSARSGGPRCGPRAEEGAFWLAFLRGLVARGLAGVQLVVSDAHEGL